MSLSDGFVTRQQFDQIVNEKNEVRAKLKSLTVAAGKGKT